MGVFKPALTVIAFAVLFAGLTGASFVLTATVHQAIASIALRAASPG
jgi:hypothetical protein